MGTLQLKFLGIPTWATIIFYRGFENVIQTSYPIHFAHTSVSSLCPDTDPLSLRMPFAVCVRLRSQFSIPTCWPARRDPVYQ